MGVRDIYVVYRKTFCKCHLSQTFFIETKYVFIPSFFLLKEISKTTLHEKCPYSQFFLNPFFPVFKLNMEINFIYFPNLRM